MGAAAQALALRSEARWKDLADVDPKHGTVGDGEARDEPHQEQDQCAEMLPRVEDVPMADRQKSRPTVPVSRSFLRPNLSMIDMAISVATRFVAPTAIACRLPEMRLAPANANW